LNIPNINNYAEAKKHFDSVKPWRGSTDRPIGNRRHSNKRMRMLDDGSIAFEYQGHTFVTYRPDGKIALQGFSCIVQLFNQVLPDGLCLMNPTSRIGATIYSAPLSQYQPGAGWCAFPYWVPRDGEWAEADIRVNYRKRTDGSGWDFDVMQVKRVDWNNRKPNPDVLVMRADKPVVLDYYADRDMWLPADETSLQPFEWDEIDKSASRKLNEEWKLGHFEAWIRAQQSLIENRQWPDRKWIIADGELLLLIKQKKFSEALEHFPRRWRWQSGFETEHEPALNHLQQLRTHLYMREGILRKRSERIVTFPELRRIKHLLYRFR
jgi:hypothetical protein